MKAMLMREICELGSKATPLEAVDWPDPEPGEQEIRLAVSVCGVCHTELDEIEGRTPPPRLPVILGHQVVGRVSALGPGASRFKPGDRVGVAWIFRACGDCVFCRRGEENLCAEFRATGRDAHGGYASFMTVHEAYAYPIPDELADAEAAPLLCAGAIGYRSLRLAGLQAGQRLGLTGFGASAHLVLKMARRRHPDSEVYVFARSESERGFARELGAVWAGDLGDAAPAKLDAIIDTTPAWKPVVLALESLERGGRLIINAIRKEDGDKDWLFRLDYAQHLWQEKEIKSVANVTRRDVSEFLEIAARIPLRPEVQEYDLSEANRALLDLKVGHIRGAKVLRIAGHVGS